MKHLLRVAVAVLLMALTGCSQQAQREAAVPTLVEYPSKYEPADSYGNPRLMIKVPTAIFGASLDSAGVGWIDKIGGVCVVEKIGASLDSAGVGWLDTDGTRLEDGTTLAALAKIWVRDDDLYKPSSLARFLWTFDETTSLRVRCAPATRLNERFATIQRESRQEWRNYEGKLLVAMSEYLAQVVDRPPLEVKVRVLKDITDAFEGRRTIGFDTQETRNGQVACRISVGNQVDYQSRAYWQEAERTKTVGANYHWDPFSITVPSTVRDVPRIQCGFVQLFPALE